MSCVLQMVVVFLCVLTVLTGIMIRLIYTREELLECRAHAGTPPTDIAAELRRRRRGKRAGIKTRERRQRNRRRYQPCLPSVVMGNMRSLANKLDEIATLTSSQQEYRECSLLCLTETWLKGDIPDGAVEIPGFTLVRADRGIQSSKRKGGGLAVFVNSKWCPPFPWR